MAVTGAFGLSGILSSSGGSGPPGSGTYASYTGIAGDPGGPTVGLSTFTLAGLVGASGLVIIIINNNTLTVNVDFTINYGAGTISVTSGAVWIAGDALAFTYKSA